MFIPCMLVQVLFVLKVRAFSRVCENHRSLTRLLESEEKAIFHPFAHISQRLLLPYQLFRLGSVLERSSARRRPYSMTSYGLPALEARDQIFWIKNINHGGKFAICMLFSYPSYFICRSNCLFQLVLVIGDFHIPHRANAMPQQFKKLLVSSILASPSCPLSLCAFKGMLTHTERS